MHLKRAIVSLLLSSIAVDAAIDDSAHLKKALAASRKQTPVEEQPVIAKRQSTDTPFLNSNTTKFAVNGSAIPDVDFDIGPSYAGQLPVGGDSDGRLWFWFFPTSDPDEPKEIIIWLNGGPGCSSLDGFLKEHGIFTWGTGTYAPVKNPWSWHHVSNIIYVEQPIGTGFSQGTVTITSEEELAEQFLGFWKNFMTTFGLEGYKVYVTGESYAGKYCPYIASAMVDKNDTTYYDISGLLIYDPVISDGVTQEVPTRYFVDYWSGLFPFNDTTKAAIANASEACGYDAFVDKYLVFPPVGPQPVPEKMPGINADGTDLVDGCELFGMVWDAILTINPGFNVYYVAQPVPIPDDVLGFPSSVFYIAPGREIYFNRTDVKKAINAPLDVNWEICSELPVFDGGDSSDPSIWHAIPNVIEKTKNVQISHGSLDFVLLANTTLLAIQNMTWGGQLGFQSQPESPLFVPEHDQSVIPGISGQGVLGTWHEERGLLWSVVDLSGHMVPTYQPALAFRQLQKLLGRVDSLSSLDPFPQYSNASQPDANDLGKGTAPILGRNANDTSGGSGGGGSSCNASGTETSASPSSTTPSAANGNRGSLSLLWSIVSSVVITGIILN